MRGLDIPEIPVGRRARARSYRVDIGPVAKLGHALVRHALGHQSPAHFRRDGAHPVEAPQDPAFKAPRQLFQAPSLLQQSRGEGSFHLEILDMQPVAGAGEEGGKSGDGRTDQRWRHRQHHIGAPDRPLPQGGEQRRSGKGRMVDHPLLSRRLVGDVVRHPGYRHAVLGALRPAPCRKAGHDAPARIVGLACDDADFVALEGQCLGHPGGVDRNADLLGRIVEADDQDAHAALPLAS